MNDQHPFFVAALYKFVALPHFEDMRAPLAQCCGDAGVSGTLLLASEGVNGTIAGTRKGIDTVLAWLRRQPGLEELEHKESWADENPFLRMKVRLKKEIVTMGESGIDPNQVVGTYVAPEDWNELISDPSVVVIDTRNDYEVDIGTFKGAIDPDIKTFREFPDWMRAQHNINEETKVAMFCTGGIRCEKSTAFAKELGIKNVYHLKGGILKYLEEVAIPDSGQDNLWEGECFVFDQRVSVGPGLELGSYDMCHACRHPITEDDKRSDQYVPGVSCPKCYDESSELQKQRYAERQRQITLAKERGEQHLGSDAPAKNADPVKA